MGKPFRVIGPANPTGIGRLPDGRFTPPPPPSPDKLQQVVRDTGKSLPEVIEANPKPPDGDEPMLWGPIEQPPKPYRIT